MSAVSAFRSASRPACAVAALLVLAGCSSMPDLSLTKETPPPCPEVRIDRMTAQAVQFQGQGRDITDMLHKVDLAGYVGECDYQDDQVILTIQPGFIVEKGPAAGSGDASGTFQYFVAIPAYYPSPAAKEVFGLGFQFPDPVTPRMQLTDEPVTLTLPRQPGESLAGLDIYVGLQLTPDQLDYNRQTGVR